MQCWWEKMQVDEVKINQILCYLKGLSKGTWMVLSIFEYLPRSREIGVFISTKVNHRIKKYLRKYWSGGTWHQNRTNLWYLKLFHLKYYFSEVKNCCQFFLLAQSFIYSNSVKFDLRKSSFKSNNFEFYALLMRWESFRNTLSNNSMLWTRKVHNKVRANSWVIFCAKI